MGGRERGVSTGCYGVVEAVLGQCEDGMGVVQRAAPEVTVEGCTS